MSSSAAGADSVFQQCALEVNGAGTEEILRCIASSLEDSKRKAAADLDQFLLVICGALVFFMQTGFAMLCAGCVRKKNVRNTLLKNLLDACGAAVAFWSIGYAFSFGGGHDDASGSKTFVGNSNFFSTGDVDNGFWFFQFAFSATCVTIVAGTLAERCQMAAYLCYSLFLTGFVYPVVVHNIWSDHGYFSPSASDPFRGVGVIDFAGSGVIHLTGGSTALIATNILGARRGRFHDAKGRLLKKPRDIQGHSIALQLMGTMVLWFGWYGFNPGSALLLTAAEERGRVASRAAVNTSFAAAFGAISAMMTNLYNVSRKTGETKFDLSRAMNGLLSGLVAITAGCGTVENWAAACTGIVAGVLYLAGSSLLVKLRLDDAVDAIPVHMFSGIWGLIATGLFSSPRGMQEAFGTDAHVGFFYSLGQEEPDLTLLGNQCLAACCILLWVASMMFPFFLTLNAMGWFRADSLEELVGLDHFYMGYEGPEVDNKDFPENSSHGSKTSPNASKSSKSPSVRRIPSGSFTKLAWESVSDEHMPPVEDDNHQDFKDPGKSARRYGWIVDEDEVEVDVESASARYNEEFVDEK